MHQKPIPASPSFFSNRTPETIILSQHFSKNGCYPSWNPSPFKNTEPLNPQVPPNPTPRAPCNQTTPRNDQRFEKGKKNVFSSLQRNGLNYGFLGFTSVHNLRGCAVHVGFENRTSQIRGKKTWEWFNLKKKV